ncbi:hypothetical protein SDC9_176765 [bioreactor metagenome]|uniref:Uncharacterized protein n=1 Tax=bioreactor metagenome TaxID=1076179 RepID=A0A645H0A8_9ZZZZ
MGVHAEISVRALNLNSEAFDGLIIKPQQKVRVVALAGQHRAIITPNRSTS